MERPSGRLLWAVGLTGLPFAVYKMGVGWFAYSNSQTALGIAAMAWGGVDIVLNILSVPFAGRVDHCLLSNIGRGIDRLTNRQEWKNILLGVDTLLAFLIVSGMIWFGALPLKPYVMGRVWDVAVVCNVLSVGLQQIWDAAHSSAACKKAML